MPTTDARGHSVPTSAEAPSRAGWVLAPLLTVKDPIPVANATARAAKIVELAGLTPAIVPSTSNPIFFFRADAGSGFELEYTTDGTTFRTVPAWADAAWAQVAATGTGGAPVAFNTGWSGYVGSPWDGVWYLKRGGWATIAGAMTKGSAVASGDVAFTMPTGFRPTKPVQGVGSSFHPAIKTTGEVFATTVGSIPLSFTITYPVA